jgi:hypothetical protein
MSERIQATISVASDDAPALQKALANAEAAATAYHFTVDRDQPGRATVTLEADDHATLVAGVEAIGPAFSPLGGLSTVDGMTFTPGVSTSLRTRVGSLAQHPAPR